MNAHKTSHLIFVFILITALVLAGSCSTDNEDNNSTGTRFNVLTINLLFSELSERSTRLEAIADFVKQRNDISDPVDIIMLQEVVGGFLSGTSNSSMDLVNMLSDRGVTYHIYYRLSNGLPALFQEGNAILSRHEILTTDYEKLPVVSEEINADFQITLRREIMMVTIRIAGYGEINVYNTHFCAFCDPSERLLQTSASLSFIDRIESQNNYQTPVVYGGDFNIDLNIQDDQSSYSAITEDNSYIDSFTFIHGCTICCSPDFGFSGCTYAVPGNTYTAPLFDNLPVDISRIDYIFTKGLTVVNSSVVFNDFPWVSDHSGLLTQVKFN